MFPTYANNQQLGANGYEKYIDSFVATVPVPFISYDNYPTKNGKLDLDVYVNLEIVSAAARKAGKPFWAFYQAVEWNVMPPRTLAELRVEAFSNLLYGAQCIQVFTYWLPPANGGEKFHDAPVDADGKRTPVYDMVKTINGEIRALSRVFMHAQILKISHAGKTLPPKATPFAPQPPLKSLDVGTGNAVVSYLKNGNATYIAILNRDLESALKLTVGFDDIKKVVEIRKDAQDRPLTETTFTVEPGDLLIFQVKP